MGSRVLASALVASPPTVNETLAVHAWCAAAGAGGAPPGAVVLAFINLGAQAVELELQLASAMAAPEPARVEFILSAPSGNLTADAVLLNGAPWGVDGAGKLPQQPVQGHAVPQGGAPLSLPATSYGFVVYPAAGAPACT